MVVAVTQRATMDTIDHYRSLAERKQKPLHVRDYTRKKTTGVTVAARRPIPPKEGHADGVL